MYRKLLIVTLLVLFFSLPAFSKELIDVASGQSHSLLLFDDGRILPYGDNCRGQLGLPKTIENQSFAETSPLYIESSVKFISVAVGLEHSLAVATDGTLWGWGSNRNTQLGINKPMVMEKPQLLDDSKDWKKVFAGGYESLALKEDGSLWNLRYLEPIQNPKGNAWKDAYIYGEPWGFGDYTLIVVLQDEENTFLTYGTCNNYRNDSSVLNAFLKEEDDDFSKLLPLKLPAGTTYFCVTDLTGLCADNNDTVVFGLSVSNYANIMHIWESIDARESYFEYLSRITVKEKTKKLKKAVMGNFSGKTTFILDSFVLEEEMHYYSYAALLQKNGRLVIYSNGEKMVSGKRIKIKNIFGGYNIFVQTEDDKIYSIGYFYPEKDFVPQNSFSYFFPIDY